ncbi:MAG: glycogen synthase GlgA [Gemmatimonadetes bacterium]|nr:glycogen synthase GlgA [Gemmatimonadota bacterium]
MNKLHVLSVASEVYPWVKTGGLGDVVGALPAALAAEGIATRTLVPGYPAVIDAMRHATTAHSYAELQGGPARVIAGRAGGLELFALDAPHLFARPGNPYLGPDGRDWPDNALRFAALGAVAADIGRGAVHGFTPQVVHAHDWQAGLAPAFLHYGGGQRPATVMTVHNLAFQGQFPRELLATIGLPPGAFAVDGVEYYGTIGYLKAGLALADRITTVSPTYAAEIRSVANGMGLDGLLRERHEALSGILNGIDTGVWDPATDRNLASPYDAKHLKARAANKAALQARLGLAPDPDALLFGVVSRLTWQKGMDLLLAALPALDAQGAQFALLGTGDAALETGFANAALERSGRAAVVIGYDETIAHMMQGGADAILVPSRFEPCGLTQLCALRYGALPVVARAGGLADTVVDANEMALSSRAGTGIVFAPDSADALAIAVERTAMLWRDRTAWRALQRRAMATDVSWSRAAARYAALYRALTAKRTA